MMSDREIEGNDICEHITNPDAPNTGEPQDVRAKEIAAMHANIIEGHSWVNFTQHSLFVDHTRRRRHANPNDAYVPFNMN